MQEDQIKIAVLEQRVEDLKEFVLKVDDAIEKISQVNVNLTKMIAVHEQRLETHQQADDNSNKKIDNIYLKMEQDHENVLNEIKKINQFFTSAETRLNNRIKKIETKQNKLNIRVGVFIGSILVISFIIQNSQFFGKMLSDPPLTNQESSAKVEKRSR